MSKTLASARMPRLSDKLAAKEAEPVVETVATEATPTKSKKRTSKKK